MANKMRKITDEEYNIAYNNIDNKRIIQGVSHKYRHSLSSQERESACNIALWRALGYFKEDKGKKFTTYLTDICKNELNRQFKKSSKKKVSVIDRDVNDLSNLIVSKTNNNQDYEHLIELMNKYISPSTCELLTEMFMYNKSISRISREKKIRKDVIEYKIEKAIKILREKNYEYDNN